MTITNNVLHQQLSEVKPQKEGLDSAPEEVKLAVDLIFLLESNNIEPNIALKALAIVEKDLVHKLNTQKA